MRNVTLGSTGITVPQNAFGALPMQRIPVADAARLAREAFEGGMRYFDTARAYSDSEIKLGEAFHGMWDKLYIASKTHALTPEGFWKDLETTLRNLRTDCLDVYQFHQVNQCWRPDDGSGMYEAMLQAKQQGKIKHIGATAHKIKVAFECVESGLYEVVMFPFSYLSGEQEIRLVQLCKEKNVGFVAMKGLAGGLITRSEAAMAFMTQYDNALPIWGIQRERELQEWLRYMDETPTMTEELAAFIAQEQQELSGEFCRGCGYCEPCPAGIMIHQCARMSLMLRRAPSKAWLTPEMQAEMKKIEGCLHCHQCMKRCPYGLHTPELLQKNYEDYQRVLAGEVQV